MMIQKQSPNGIHHLSYWLFGYFAFIALAIFISYYLNIYPPQSTALNLGHYIASSVNHPNDLPKDKSLAIVLPDMKTAALEGRTEGWYEIPVTNTATLLNNKRLRLYIPVVNQNVEVFLNDRWLGNGGRMEPPIDRNYNNPLIFNFSDADLDTENNVFYIHVKGLLPRWTYLGEVYAGSEAILRPVYEKRKLLRVNLIIFTSVALVFTSLFTAFLWLLRRKKAETYYLWYSLAELLWAAHDTNLFIKRVPFSDTLWESLVALTIGWSILCFIFFFHRYMGQYNAKLDRVILCLGLVFSLPFGYQNFEWVVFYGYQVWLLFVLVVGLYGGGLMFHRYIKTKDQNVLVLMLAASVMIAFGVHDLLATQAILPPSSPYMMSISALLIILVISSLLIRRFVESLEVVEHYNESLQQQILQKEEQLRREYKKTQILQKRQILSEERERMMRDIHDGIGGQLITTLASTNSADVTISQVQDNLKLALQDLRMVIDSLDGESQELLVILATLRTRLEVPLRQANIVLVWRVQDLPMLEEFGPEKALNTMRIVQEAICNIIKHSGASQLTVSAYPEIVDGKQVAVVTVADNGCGMPKAISAGRGLSNMRNRADQIGVILSVKPVSDCGTVVRLVFHPS